MLGSVNAKMLQPREKNHKRPYRGKPGGGYERATEREREREREGQKERQRAKARKQASMKEIERKREHFIWVAYGGTAQVLKDSDFASELAEKQRPQVGVQQRIKHTIIYPFICMSLSLSL